MRLLNPCAGTTGSAKSEAPGGRAAAGTGIASLPLPDAPPVILSQPEFVPLREGANGFLAVRAAGVATGYAWQHNGVAIPGATNALLWFAPAKLTNSGLYTLVLSNSLGMTTSQPIAVAVGNVDVQQLVRLEWEADAPSVFKAESCQSLGPAARWDGSVYALTGSGPILVPDPHQNRPACFFRLAGWAGSRLNRLDRHLGFKLDGPVGSRRTVEYVGRETGWTNWLVLTNLTLAGSPQMFVGGESTWATLRVYRVKSVP